MATHLENYLFGSRFFSLEIFTHDGKDKIALLDLELKKKEISILESRKYDMVSGFTNEKFHAPTVVTLNNAMVLQKKIPVTDGDDKKVVHSAFPNIELNNFCYEIWRYSSFTIVAVCRKNYITDIVQQLSESFSIVGVRLGLCPLSSIADLGLPVRIVTNSQTLVLSDVDTAIYPAEEDTAMYELNGLTVSNEDLIPFAASIRIMLGLKNTSGNIHEDNNALQENYKQKRFFEKGVRVVIVGLLAVLLVNFLLFSYFFKQVTEMEATMALDQNELQNIKIIKEEVSRKTQKLKSFEGAAASRSTYIINKLVKTIPTAIGLSEIQYNPLQKKIKQDEPIAVQPNVLSVTGTTVSPNAFTAWIHAAENIAYIDKITIISFGSTREDSTEFTIVINIKANETQ